MTDPREMLTELNNILYKVLEEATDFAVTPEEGDFIQRLREEAEEYERNFDYVLAYWDNRDRAPSHDYSDLESRLTTGTYSHPNTGPLEYSIYSTHSPNPSENMMYFLTATTNSERKIRLQLEEIRRQASRLPNGWGYRVLIGVNNSQDETFRRILEWSDQNTDLNLTAYNINNPLPGFGKRQVINFMASTLNRNGNSFITIVDDDIGFPKGSNIMSNVQKLEEDENLKVTSATYATFRRTDGFHRVFSARKVPELLDGLVLPRVYGGCLTIKLEDFPEDGIPENGSDSDLYFSLSFLHELMDRTGKDVRDLNESQLPARTNPDLMVEHSETYVFPYFAYRVIRDLELRESTTALFGDGFYERFRFLQWKYFERITQRVNDLPHTDLTRISHTINRMLRKQIMYRYTEGELTSKDLRRLWIPQFEEGDDYQFCKTFMFDPERRDRAQQDIAWQLENGETDRLGDPSVTEKSKFKIIETGVRRIMDGPGIDTLRDPSSDVVHLSRIITSNAALREKIYDPATIGDILTRAGLPVSGPVEVEPCKEYGRANYHIFSRSGPHGYFMRYHDPLGKEFFLKHSPRASVFAYLVTEEVFGLLMGRDSVVNTLFPSFNQAKRNYLGAEAINDVEKILQRVIIQRDLREDHVVWSNYVSQGGDVDLSIGFFGSLMGKLHGSSLGFIGQLNKRPDELDNRRLAREILMRNRGLMRNHDPSTFIDWLTEYSWITRQFQRKLVSPDNLASQVNSRFSGGYRGIWDQTNETTKQNIGILGTLGHYDFTPYNEFIQLDPDTMRPKRAVLYDFDYLSFHDPFYECGHGLYSLNNFLNLKDQTVFNLDESMRMTHLFFDSYRTAFVEAAGIHLGQAAERMGQSPEQIMTEGLRRASRYCGFITLAVINQEKFLQGKDRETFLDPFCDLCYHLIDAGHVE